MNRPFWLFRSASSEDICTSLEPLLSAYADGMASPADARRIEAHLPECKGCRTVLSWMQATHTALASRPVAVPPPDLHSRIALAIAASSPAPVQLRPVRVFTVRAAYAAAASVTALGIALIYPLLHTPSVATGHPAKPAVFASTGKPQLAPKTPTRPLVASGVVKPAVRPAVIAHRAVPTSVTSPEHVAANIPPVRLPAAPQEVIAPVHHAPPVPKMASRDIAPTDKHSPEKHTPLPQTVLPKPLEGPRVAKIIKEPIHIPLDISTPKVTPDAPPVQTASASHFAPPKLDYGMGELRAHLRLQNATYAPMHITRQEISRGAANAMQTVGTVGNDDQTAVVAGVYSPR